MADEKVTGAEGSKGADRFVAELLQRPRISAKDLDKLEALRANFTRGMAVVRRLQGWYAAQAEHGTTPERRAAAAVKAGALGSTVEVLRHGRDKPELTVGVSPAQVLGALAAKLEAPAEGPNHAAEALAEAISELGAF